MKTQNRNFGQRKAKISDPAVHEDSKWEIRTAKMQKYQIPVAQRGIAQIKQIQVYTCENTFVKWVFFFVYFAIRNAKTVLT